jgi:hypothetical protein
VQNALVCNSEGCGATSARLDVPPLRTMPCKLLDRMNEPKQCTIGFRAEQRCFVYFFYHKQFRLGAGTPRPGGVALWRPARHM